MITTPKKVRQQPAKPNPDAPGAEVAWVGGFFSGEGSISNNANYNGRLFLQMSIGNTDRGALERCRAVIGGILYGPYLQQSNLQRLPSYVLKLGNTADIRAVVEMLRPWLSPLKAAQADRALAALETNPPIRRSGWKFGVPRGRTRLGGDPCRQGHDGSQTYEYTAPGGRSMQKCRACQRESGMARRAGANPPTGQPTTSANPG
jgi:hypothetical protein